MANVLSLVHGKATIICLPCPFTSVGLSVFGRAFIFRRRDCSDILPHSYGSFRFLADGLVVWGQEVGVMSFTLAIEQARV